MTRCRSCSIPGLCSILRNSGWPNRNVCSRGLLALTKFDNIRNSSTELAGRFCASSTIRSARLPCLWVSTRNCSILLSRHRLAVFLGQAKCRSHHPHHVIRLQISAHDLRQHDFLEDQFPGKRIREHGLACADFSGDDDETFALMRAKHQVSHRAAVAFAGEEKARVGGQLKRLSPELVKTFVHKRQNLIATVADTAFSV